MSEVIRETDKHFVVKAYVADAARLAVQMQAAIGAQPVDMIICAATLILGAAMGSGGIDIDATMPGIARNVAKHAKSIQAFIEKQEAQGIRVPGRYTKDEVDAGLPEKDFPEVLKKGFMLPPTKE